MKQDLEQILLISALFVLGLLSVGASFLFVSIEKPSQKSSLKDVQPFDEAAYETLPTTISDAHRWAEKEHKLFVSRLLAYTFGTHSTRHLELDDLGPDGISYRWRKENGFAMDDATVASADPDGDGFTNLEEYLAKTDPNNKDSHPPSIAKLRLDKFIPVPFKIIFRGYTVDVGEKYAYQLNMQNKSLLVKEGDRINISQFKVDQNGWKVGEFRLIKIKEPNQTTGALDEIDKSELDLMHPLLQDQKITLIRNMPIESDESRVNLIALIPNLPPINQISKGQIFQFKDGKYQLMKASSSGAEIRDVETGQVINIAPITSAERAKLARDVSAAGAR